MFQQTPNGIGPRVVVSARWSAVATYQYRGLSTILYSVDFKSILNSITFYIELTFKQAEETMRSTRAFLGTLASESPLFSPGQNSVRCSPGTAMLLCFTLTQAQNQQATVFISKLGQSDENYNLTFAVNSHDQEPDVLWLYLSGPTSNQWIGTRS